jgi:hypothetical protein
VTVGVTVGVKVRFGFGLGIIFLTFKTFGNNFKISHRKAPLPISSAARLDVRKDTEVPDPCVSVSANNTPKLYNTPYCKERGKVIAE